MRGSRGRPTTARGKTSRRPGAPGPDDDTGLPTREAFVAALAGALKRLLDNRTEAEALGRRARERCEARYSFRVARATLFPLLEKLTERR